MLGGLEIIVLFALLVGMPVLILLWLRPRYRQLAEQTTATQEATERRLDEIAAELSSIHTQLASLERVLTQLE